MFETLMAQSNNAEAAPQNVGFLEAISKMVPLFLIIIVVMYLLIWRPQRKQQDERENTLKSIKKNDRIVTYSGIYGVVVSVKENTVVLRIDEAKDVKIHIDITAIARVEERIEKKEDEKKE